MFLGFSVWGFLCFVFWAFCVCLLVCSLLLWPGPVFCPFALAATCLLALLPSLALARPHICPASLCPWPAPCLLYLCAPSWVTCVLPCLPPSLHTTVILTTTLSRLLDQTDVIIRLSSQSSLFFACLWLQFSRTRRWSIFKFLNSHTQTIGTHTTIITKASCLDSLQGGKKIDIYRANFLTFIWWWDE